MFNFRINRAPNYVRVTHNFIALLPVDPGKVRQMVLESNITLITLRPQT